MGRRRGGRRRENDFRHRDHRPSALEGAQRRPTAAASGATGLPLVDDAGAEIEAYETIIRPDGWTIPAEVAAIHGITTEQALAEGIPEAEAVWRFMMMQGRAGLRVAHNETFDRRIMRIAMARAGMARDFIEAIEARPSFCTCTAAKPIVNLPPTEKMLAAGFTGPKQPNLGECVQHFFGEALEGAHGAMVDARACARVYGAIVARLAGQQAAAAPGEAA